MRRSVFTILLILSLPLWPPFPSAAATRTVRVGVFPAAPLVKNTAGRPEGLFIDLVECFARDLDWRVEYVDKPWSELLVSLERGEIDLLPAVAVTDERGKIYDFSLNPPFIDAGVLFVRPNFPLKTVFDLHGLRVAGVKGSIFTNAFETYAASFGVKCDIVYEVDNAAVMQSVAAGRADAGICIYSLGIELARTYPVSISAISFSPIALSFAVPKGRNQDLIAGIDQIMAPMIKDPDSLYSRSFNRWILPEASGSLSIWIWWGIGALGCLGLLVAAWNLSLRRQVAAKTKVLTAEIAERRRSEEEREKLQAQLNQVQKMDSIGQLAGGVAHDFNNMLGVILGHVEMLLEPSRSDPVVRSGLMEIEQAARRSADLTRQLLAFARKQIVAPKPLDLNESVEGALKMLRRLIGEGIELIWLPGAGLWTIYADPGQIDQILANLSVNARDAVAGAGRIVIRTENVHVGRDQSDRIDVLEAGDYVLLSVSDNGCGMAPEIQARAFEPFFTTKAVGQGTGLGLATVYGIVKQSDGFISLESQPGKGTSFRIYLPRHAGERQASTSVEPAAAAVPHRETLLLVEDEPHLLTMCETYLKKQGYRVLSAGAPDEAVRLYAGRLEEIDLLVTDVVMPGMNGKELYERLRESKPALRCLYMSGYALEVIGRHGVIGEDLHFIQKPFSMRAFAGKVREALER